MNETNTRVLIAELRAEAHDRHTRALTLRGNAEQEERRSQKLNELLNRVEKELDEETA